MKSNLLVIGEVLIDRYRIDGKVKDNVAGAPLNVAIVLKHLKKTVSVVGAIGNDKEGIEVLNYLKSIDIGTEDIQVTNSKTTIANITIDKGERSFKFDRGADANLLLDDKTVSKLVDESEVVHFGSATAFLGSNLLSTYLKFLSYSNSKNKLVFFDPNFREDLCKDNNSKKLFINNALTFIDKSDVIKMSSEEFEIIFNNKDIKSLCFINNYSNKIFLITLGDKGACLINKGELIHIKPERVCVPVDTTGAGDSFIGCFIANYKREFTIKQTVKLVQLCNMYASYVVEKVGFKEALIDIEKYNIISKKYLET
jgi:fructokinase